jgi:NADP-dependent 3-hydroxy acid dehydrogenase YdfG
VEIKDKVVIVTGASSGLGEATARLAHHAGARVVLAVRRCDRLSKLAEDLAGALAVPTDVTSAQAVHQLRDSAKAHFETIDVPVNNAGQGLPVPLMEVDRDVFQAVCELNVMAHLALMQAIVPAMAAQGSGAIVNVSSVTYQRMIPGLGAYSSTKSALNILSQVARAELGGLGITVSVVYPALTVTEFHQSLRAGRLPGAARRMDAARPEAVAEVIMAVIGSGEAEAHIPRPAQACHRNVHGTPVAYPQV